MRRWSGARWPRPAPIRRSCWCRRRSGRARRGNWSRRHFQMATVRFVDKLYLAPGDVIMREAEEAGAANGDGGRAQSGPARAGEPAGAPDERAGVAACGRSFRRRRRRSSRARTMTRRGSCGTTSRRRMRRTDQSAVGVWRGLDDEVAEAFERPVGPEAVEIDRVARQQDEGR